MRVLLFFITLLILCLNVNAIAQTSGNTNTIVLKKHSPKRAANMSALVPGLGQVYNKQYYKVPIIYAGGVALVYSMAWNNRQYNKYLDAFKLDSDTSASTNSQFAGVYSVNNLIVLKDYYRRNRDLSAIVLVLLYTANIIDAYVYGHFYNFDVSDDLSLKVNPYIAPMPNRGLGLQHATGVSLTLSFKK